MTSNRESFGDMANAGPGHRPPWVEDELFPFRSRFVDISGNVVHYVDEGEGPVLLMYHGNPTWSFLYRHLITGLRNRFRCVAFDHPGFGLSTATEGYGYSYAEHTNVASQFVESLDLTDITLFVQDWGGPIGLGAATRQPDRYRSLILGNTFAWRLDRLTWKVTSRVLGGPAGRWFIQRTNFLAKSVSSTHKRRTMTRSEAEHYTKPYPDPLSRTPHAIFLRQLTAAGPELQVLEESLAAIRHLPALILWGDKDSFYKKPEASRIEALFPNHTTHVLEDVGHFIQDDAPEEIIETIQRWWPPNDQPES